MRFFTQRKNKGKDLNHIKLTKKLKFQRFCVFLPWARVHHFGKTNLMKRQLTSFPNSKLQSSVRQLTLI